MLSGMCYNTGNDGRKRRMTNVEILSNLVITKVYSASTMYTPQNTKTKKSDRPRWAIVIECALTFSEPFGFSVKNGEKILKMIKALEYRRNLKKPMTEMESIRDTYSIILALTESANGKYSPSDKQQKLAPAIEYISQNYNTKMSNGELAALTGLSTVYFRKLFTQIMGVSPVAFVHELRIAKAKEMLRSDYGTLADIAQSLGYSNLFDFSRDFKKHTGSAPSGFTIK